MTSITAAEPSGAHQSKKAAASGWIGSALEYYDFFIYATAASLVFPQIFFPSGNPTAAIVASLATYGVGYVARPIGAFVLGHWGDTHGRKTRAAGLHVPDGLLDDGRRRSADLPAGRPARAGAAGRPAPDPGLRGRRRDLRRQFDDPGARAVRAARLFRQLLAAGRAGGADPRRGGVPAARAFHADGGVQCLGLAGAVPAERLRHPRRLHHSPRGRRNAGLRRRGPARRGAEAPIVAGVQYQLAGHAPRRLHGADECHSGGGDHFRRRLCGAAGLWHRLSARTSICGSRCSATSSRCS